MRKDIKNKRRFRDIPTEIPEEIAEATEQPEESDKPRQRKSRGTSGVLKYIIAAVLLLALVYGAVKLIGSVNVSDGTGNVVGQIELESSAQYDFAVLGKNVISCNAGGVFAYDKNGNEKWRIEKVLSKPSAYVYEENLLVTDSAQNSAMVINKSGKIKTEINFATECISASVNKNGWVSAILSLKGYKAQVAVFDNEGKMRYTWNSANNDIISAELADDNKTLAVAQLDSSSSVEANGVVSLFDITTEGKPYSGKNTEANIVTYLRWSGKKLVCVGNKSALKIDSTGKELWKYDYPGEMQAYNADFDDVFAFAISPNTTSSAKSVIVYTVNDDGKELGSTEIVGEIKNIEISGSNIAAITSDKIVRLKKNASVKNEYSLSRDVSKGLAMDGGSSFFVVSGTSAEILSLN